MAALDAELYLRCSLWPGFSLSDASLTILLEFAEPRIARRDRGVRGRMLQAKEPPTLSPTYLECFIESVFVSHIAAPTLAEPTDDGTWTKVQKRDGTGNDGGEFMKRR